MASDKEGGVDSLSSIEVVVADGLDVMAMQNWEHVQVRFPARAGFSFLFDRGLTETCVGRAVCLSKHEQGSQQPARV